MFFLLLPVSVHWKLQAIYILFYENYYTYDGSYEKYMFVTTASVVWWSEFLATDPEVRVRFLALPDSLRSSGSGTGSTQPREYS
jgi:hypothetical protein